MDLLDFWRGDMSIRRLWVLLQHKVIIPGTATAVAIHGDAGWWKHSDYILAAVADAHIKGGFPRPKDKVAADRLDAMLAVWTARYRPEGGDQRGS